MNGLTNDRVLGAAEKIVDEEAAKDEGSDDGRNDERLERNHKKVGEDHQQDDADGNDRGEFQKEYERWVHVLIYRRAPAQVSPFYSSLR